jgi:hypothetical protein
MNNTDKIAGLKRTIKQAQVEIKDLESQQGKRFKPEIGDFYWYVLGSGGVAKERHNNRKFDDSCFNSFNCYETEELATKAAKYMKRNNAIIMACSIVDPDFVPDYLSGNQEHHSFEYKNTHLGYDEKWGARASYFVNCGPCVSTEAKWEEAAALLKEWGVE